METSFEEPPDENDSNRKFSMACSTCTGFYFMDIIMPNHIHVLWEQLKMNGKETPKGSFEKYTGHVFLKRLRLNKENLEDYITKQKDRNYLFWQRDPLAIQITSRKMTGEKLDYMHYPYFVQV